MTEPGSTTTPGTGLCWYGMQRLPPLLDAFTSEIGGVREAEDIEYIHRMRVASRRLRAALPLFSTCFPAKQYEKWMQELTKITRALGDARDADVQIAFLQKSLKKLQKDAAAKNPVAQGGKPSTEPAIRFLLPALQRKRGLLQKRVLSALAGFEKKRIAEDMQQAFALLQSVSGTRKKPPLYGIPPLAAFRIAKRLAILHSYDPWVLHPEAVAEHHATRIAAKKLRYTMEIYGPVYRNGLKKPLARVKKIQEILGDIHDCDVWIDHITHLLLRERSLLRSSRSKRPDTATLSSLKALLQDREAGRKRHYRQFVHFWQAMARQQLWDELRRTLDTGRRTRFLPPREYADRDLLNTVHLMVPDDPGAEAHSRLVTQLALMLFDETRALHNFGPHDRVLLECAGLLHERGLKHGQSGHAGRGASLIIADEALPLDLAERGIIGLAVLLHRGRPHLSGHPFFSLLSPGDQKKTLMLAALLRVADGLDVQHTGLVREVHCAIGTTTVVCDVTAAGDASAEKERAGKKADLFLQVFGRNLVIR
jgi:CHAD domain-containing protein